MLNNISLTEENIASATVPRRRLYACVLAMLLTLSGTSPWILASNLPLLSTDAKYVTAGYFQLSWRANGDQFQLEQRRGDETVHWRIEDRRSFAVTGLPDGNYRYRVRALEPESGAWSEPVVVEVQHHSLVRAWLFFAAGLVVFAGLVGVILVNRRN